MLHVKLCRECFKKGYDDTAPDRFLLLSKEEEQCEFCHKNKRIVIKYYKYGEHEVTPEGLYNKDNVRHLGVNPNHSCWGPDRYPYNDRVVTES